MTMCAIDDLLQPGHDNQSHPLLVIKNPRRDIVSRGDVGLSGGTPGLSTTYPSLSVRWGRPHPPRSGGLSWLPARIDLFLALISDSAQRSSR